MEFSKDIECKAIDSFGHVGYLYDKRQDRVLAGWNKTTIRSSSSSLQSSFCELANGSTDTSFNLLQFIHIDGELRLNLLLQATKRVGIASIMSYSYRIDEWTRVLYYSYINRREFVNDIKDVEKMLELSDHQRCATHVITGVNFGIDLVVVIRLKSEAGTTAKIDNILGKMSLYLRSGGNSSIVPLNDEDIPFLERNTNLTAYSNMPFFTGLSRISEIPYYIDRYKSSNTCQPISYYLRPTKQLHPQYEATVRDISPTVIEKIEQFLLQLRIPIQHLEASFTQYTPKSVDECIPDFFNDAQQQWSSLRDRYRMVVQYLGELINGLRCGRYDASTVHSALRHNELSTLRISIDQLAQHVRDSEGQNSSTMPSPQQPFNYHNSVEQHSYKNNSTRSTDAMDKRANRHYENFQASGALNNNNGPKRNNFNQVSIDENRNNSSSSSTSVDHLYPVLPLQNKILPLENIESNENQSRPSTPSPADVPETPVLPELHPPSNDPIINILLLGETGIGKSTFINAFVNYLSFDTFEQAELNKPVVLIPVSFLMTVGDNFEERTVKFGAIDDSKNEDFDHSGQSVTQHCKSYIFHLKDGKKLCIIDTPDFGDTRGLDQDDRNMQNILEYINNLDHLNAICFLLKPNTSRLNIFFRSCITQILDLLGPTICENLAFCFTNARTNFYTLGDTAPLLKQMLQSLSIKDIPFEKENTFCFDNISFRYLVALRDGIPFKTKDQQECGKSWSVAVKESNRLIEYIRTKLILYPKQGKWQSAKHAQFEINYMIRPILETMRNILRNIILQNTRARNKSIELNPTVIHRSASLCLSCKQVKIQIENFSIIEDCPHELQNTCLHCPCPPEQHIRIDYMLGYKSVNTSSNLLKNNTNDKLNQLCEVSATFAYFLVSIARYTNEDPFELGLTRMIIQENELCHNRDSSYLNSQLTKKLMELQAKYNHNINRIKSNPERISLPQIYDLMKTICEFPMVETQMNAVGLGREIIMKQHENEHQEIW
jgi:hypothetical protein